MRHLVIGSSIACTAVLAHVPSRPDTTPLPELDALMRPFELVDVGAAADGLVESVLVERGDLVEQGQVLALLDFGVERASTDLAKARAEADSTLQMAHVDLADREVTHARYEAMHEKGIVPEEILQRTLTDKRLAELAVSRAQEDRLAADLEYSRAKALLARGTVKSPVRGVVTKRLLSPGELVSRSGQDTILQIAQIDPLIVELNAPVELLGRITVGMSAEVLPEEPVGGSYTAEVTVVDRVIDTASGTFGVRLRLPNTDYRLPAGLRCRLRFTP